MIREYRVQVLTVHWTPIVNDPRGVQPLEASQQLS
jgi:hypothetical protein